MSVDSVLQTLKEAAPQQQSFAEAFNAQRSAIERALPAHMNPDRLLRIATTVVRKTPKLQGCTTISLLGALMTSAQVGLEPGPLQHCYIVPRNNSYPDPENKGEWVKVLEAEWQIGYPGIQELARRSGLVGGITAAAVYDGDEFDYQLGTAQHLIHRPLLRGDRGEPYAYWAVVDMLGEARDIFEVLTVAQVEEIRDKSAQGTSKANSPWNKWPDSMAKKTVVRQLRNYLPQSSEMAHAWNADGTVRTDLEPEALEIERPPELEPAPQDGDTDPYDVEWEGQ